jgi:hypothetical protein
MTAAAAAAAPATLPPLTPSLKHVFDRLALAASRGERCPLGLDVQSDLIRTGLPIGKQALGGHSSATTALAVRGYIRVRVHARNWRVVEIQAGPHAGRETQGPPNHTWRYYLVVDRNGPRRVETW